METHELGSQRRVYWLTPDSLVDVPTTEVVVVRKPFQKKKKKRLQQFPSPSSKAEPSI